MLAAGAVLIAGGPASAFLGIREGVRSLRPTKPVVVDGRSTEWQVMPVSEAGNFGFRAMNDDSTLYLLISATTDKGLAILIGAFHQDVTLWALATDKHSRLWGVRIPYSALGWQALNSAGPSPTLDGIGLNPENVVPDGLIVSTASLPPGVKAAGDLTHEFGIKPTLELEIPLKELQEHGRQAYLEFTVAEASPEAKKEAERQTSATRVPAAAPPRSAGERQDEHHAHHAERAATLPLHPPQALDMPLTIKLAKS